MTPDDTAVVGAACCFPSGPTLDLAGVAVRSRLCLTRTHPTYRDVTGMAVRLSYFPAESPGFERFDAARWGLLARHTLAQLTRSMWSARARLRQSPRWLWLVVPDHRRPAIPAGLDESLRTALRHDLWDWERVSIVHGGHAAGLLALQEAHEVLCESSRSPTAGLSPVAVVIAVESAIDAGALAWLDAQERLHGSGVAAASGYRAQPYGRVPGEGAAAVALMAASSIDDASPAPWAGLAACATSLEASNEADGGLCTGIGLTDAAATALTRAGAGLQRVRVVYTDLNGETSRANEFGFVTLRLSDQLVDGWTCREPAIASGDLHCASSLMHVALSAHCLRRNPGDSPHLVLASSDDSLRGAAVLTRA